MAESRSPALVLSGVDFDYPGSRALLTGCSLTVDAGEVVALLGENGSGKTTLISLCLGFRPPKAGQILVAGISVLRANSEIRALTAYVPEIANLYPSMTGRELIQFFGKLSGLGPGSSANSQMAHVLETVRFPAAALDQRSRTYSKGMRQKLVLALGLLKGARLFLLDEPTSGLDPVSRIELARALRRLADAGGAILLATHDVEAAREAGARIVRLREGTLSDEVRPPMVDGSATR